MTTVLHIRGVSDEAAARFRRGARVRGLTLGEYLERLQALHDVVREDGLIIALILAGLTLPTED